MCKSMFGPEVIRRVELCFFRPCAKLTSLQDREPRTSETHHVVISADKLLWRQRPLNFFLYKPCAMCLSWLHFQPCAGSEPDYNCCCCLSNKYTYMQFRSPEVTRVNSHLTRRILPNSTEGIMDYMTKDCTESLAIS